MVKPTVPSPTETSVKVVKVTKVTAPPPAPAPSTLSLSLLNDLDALRRRLEVTESSLTYHLHLPLGENSVRECSLNLQKLQVGPLPPPCPRGDLMDRHPGGGRSLTSGYRCTGRLVEHAVDLAQGLTVG